MAASEPLKLGARALRLADLRRVYEGPVTVALDGSALTAVREAHAVTQRLAAADAPAYGINTGFGLLAHTRIARCCSGTTSSRTRAASGRRSMMRWCASHWC